MGATMVLRNLNKYQNELVLYEQKSNSDGETAFIEQLQLNKTAMKIAMNSIEGSYI